MLNAIKCCGGVGGGDKGIKGVGGFIPPLFPQNSPVATFPSQRRLFFSLLKLHLDQNLARFLVSLGDGHISEQSITFRNYHLAKKYPRDHLNFKVLQYSKPNVFFHRKPFLVLGRSSSDKKWAPRGERKMLKRKMSIKQMRKTIMGGK